MIKWNYHYSDYKSNKWNKNVIKFIMIRDLILTIAKVIL